MDKQTERAAANENPAGTQILYSQYAEAGRPYSCEYIPDIPYVTYGEQTLKLQIIKPMGTAAKFPLVVFVQGSGWQKQSLYFQIPNLALIAAQGYVIASVEYRPIPDAQFPAQLEDVKCAIRFMRKKRSNIWRRPGAGCSLGRFVPAAIWR